MAKSFSEKIISLNRAVVQSVRAADQEGIVKQLLLTATEVFEADFAYAFIKNSSNQFKLVYKTPSTPYDPQVPRKGGIVARTFLSSRPRFITDVLKMGFVRSDAKQNMRGVAVIPIYHKKTRFGALVICYKKPHIFTAEEKSVFDFLGNTVAQALTINRLYADLSDFKRTLDNTLDSILIFDAKNCKISYANEGAALLTRKKHRELINAKFFDVVDGLSQKELEERMKEIRTNDNLDYLVFESTINGHKKVQWPVEISLQHVKQKNQPERFLAIVRDITERKQSEDTIRQMAYFDSLTKLPNRILFNERIRQELERVEETKGKFAVFFIDLDRFKVINDIYGHQVGDELLVAVATRLQRSLPRKATLCRMGGDEFMVLLPKIKEAREAVECAKRIKDSFIEYFQLEDQEVYVNSSVGLAIFPLDGDDIRTVMKHADLALHRAKEQGGNSYQQYNQALPIFYSMQPQMESQLRKAIKDDELVIHYQPVVSMHTGKIAYSEALVRWNHPEMGLLYPDTFISQAEESGLIVDLGNWIINEVCRQIKSWRDSGKKVLPVSINVSPRQLLNTNFVNQIQAAFASHKVKISDVKLELTETFLMKNIDLSVGILEQLKLLGLKILIDDFGTGYASLNYLKRLPIDGVKIDKAFIQGSAENLQDAALTSAIISIAHQLNLEAIAEGVETKGQVKMLEEHRCNFAQGNLFYKPMPGKDFAKLLEKKK